jgi:hypothetical protein
MTSTLPYAAAVGLAPTLAIITTYILGRRESRRAANTVAAKVDDVAQVAAETNSQTGEKLEQIHVLVNSRLSEALDRIGDLEAKLGIPPGAPIPPPP